MKKVILWVVLAFLVYFVVDNPSGAAATAKDVGAGLAEVASSIGVFLSELMK